MAEYIDRNGKPRRCRIASLDESADDPMNYGAPMGDIYNQARKDDLRDGCPECRADVLENASEPDVMSRWDLR
jgi:hypothetical protein